MNRFRPFEENTTAQNFISKMGFVSNDKKPEKDLLLYKYKLFEPLEMVPVIRECGTTFSLEIIPFKMFFILPSLLNNYHYFYVVATAACTRTIPF